jgi:ketosteroid isomerase-like protein
MPEKTSMILGDIYDAWRIQKLDLLASYLPDDFCHVVHFSTQLDALAGECRGKSTVIERWHSYMEPFDYLRFETTTLMVAKDRAAAEINLHFRHRETGCDLKTVKVNFWTMEGGWPVRLTEYYDVEALEAFAAEVRARASAEA